MQPGFRSHSRSNAQRREAFAVHARKSRDFCCCQRMKTARSCRRFAIGMSIRSGKSHGRRGKPKEFPSGRQVLLELLAAANGSHAGLWRCAHSNAPSAERHAFTQELRNALVPPRGKSARSDSAREIGIGIVCELRLRRRITGGTTIGERAGAHAKGGPLCENGSRGDDQCFFGEWRRR